ncbi:nickel-type superoxide dismutase maturation protease [Pleurocapsales cyanobacterium LEGE 10410]|nr:nickel-type superoxide dismutase maturation protease [Pleurocapsales cyanobacterium LEGE 10410]
MRHRKNILPKTNYRELLLLLLRRRKRLKITGRSMLPLLQPGTEILIDPHAYYKSPPRIDDIVVTTHPHDSQLTIVKRITAIDPQGKCFLTGDNLVASKDSRHWGTVSSQDIIGKVTSCFS